MVHFICLCFFCLGWVGFFFLFVIPQFILNKLRCDLRAIYWEYVCTTYFNDTLTQGCYQWICNGVELSVPEYCSQSYRQIHSLKWPLRYGYGNKFFLELARYADKSYSLTSDSNIDKLWRTLRVRIKNKNKKPTPNKQKPTKQTKQKKTQTSKQTNKNPNKLQKPGSVDSLFL